MTSSSGATPAAVAILRMARIISGVSTPIGQLKVQRRQSVHCVNAISDMRASMAASSFCAPVHAGKKRLMKSCSER